MLIYELLNFDGPYQDEANRVRSILKGPSKKGYRWIELTSSIRRIVESPDLTIISSHGMPLSGLRMLIAQASGSMIVLHGARLDALGVHCFDQCIDVDVLNELLPPTSASELAYSDTGNGRWVSTIPMPLPLF